MKPASPFWGAPQTSLLSGNRLHLQQGPIDLIIKAKGETADVWAAYEAATIRFQTVLAELVSELGLLREPLTQRPPPLKTPVAVRMLAACWPHRAAFITPMAAVAGAVTDEVLRFMVQAAPKLHSTFVNNGGDIACHVNAGHALRIGLVKDLLKAAPEGAITIEHPCGIATSGWRGRSFSLGIADAVTVLANSAAMADAAASIIANAVNTNDQAISRQPAQSIDPDSDLGDLMVTTGVGSLRSEQVEMALERGARTAQALLDQRLIAAAMLSLQGALRIVQDENAKLLP